MGGLSRRLGFTFSERERENVSSLEEINAATRQDIDATRLCPDATTRLSRCNDEPNRCYCCGKGFRSHNRLHTHLASRSCEDMLLNATHRIGHRGRAISIMTEKPSRGRTSHIQIADRGRATSTHRRDVLDIATSRNAFPYLQSHFPNHQHCAFPNS